MRARLPFTAMLLLSVGFIACDGDDPTGPFEEFAGTFDLVEVDGQSLPFVYEGAGFTLTYVEGTLDLNGDGTWSDEFVVLVHNDGGEPYADTTGQSGTFEEGEEVDLVLDVNGTIEDTQYMVDIDGDEVTYQRGAIQVTFED